MTINLTELINTPGYGKAEAALRKVGLWDDTKIVDGETEMLFKVKVTGWYEPLIEAQYFDVEAETEDDALDAAEDLCDFYEIDDAEIVSVKEIQ